MVVPKFTALVKHGAGFMTLWGTVSKRKRGDCVHMEYDGCNDNLLSDTARANTSVVLFIFKEEYSNLDHFEEVAVRWVEFLKLFNPDIKLDMTNRPFSEIFELNERSYSTLENDEDDEYCVYEAGVDTNNWRDLSGRFWYIHFPMNDLYRSTFTLARYLVREMYSEIPEYVLHLYEGGVKPVTALYLGHYGIPMYPGFDWDGIKACWNDYKIGKVSRYRFEDKYANVGRIYENYYGLVFPQVFNPEELDALTPAEFMKMAGYDKNGCRIALNKAQSRVARYFAEDTLRDYPYVSQRGASFLINFMTYPNKHEEFVKDVVKPTQHMFNLINTCSPKEFVETVKEINKSIYA